MSHRYEMATTQYCPFRIAMSGEELGEDVLTGPALVLGNPDSSAFVVQGESFVDLLATIDRWRDAIGAAALSKRLEVLVVRDPDGGDEVTVFQDGIDVTSHVQVTVVDPGAGHSARDWAQSTDEVRADFSTSDAFREATREARARYDDAIAQLDPTV